MTGTINDTLNIDIVSAGSCVSTPEINDVTTLDSTTIDTIKTCSCEVNDQTGTSYTITASDMCKTVTLSNAAAITLTCPEDSTENLTVGFHCRIVQLGAGQTTVAIEGTDNLRSADGDTKLRVQYSTGELIKLASGEWLLYGDITT